MQLGRLCRLVAGYLAIVAVLGSVVGGFRLHSERWQSLSLDALASAALCLTLNADGDGTPSGDHSKAQTQACAACSLPAAITPAAPFVASAPMVFVQARQMLHTVAGPPAQPVRISLGSRAPPSISV